MTDNREREANQINLSFVVPLINLETKRVGGQFCDMRVGPCACGAWHDESDFDVEGD